jgi:hypothetical protein
LLFDLIPFLSLITLPLAVVTLVFSAMLHYQMWQAVPERFRRTTPGKAVGFLFIPFFIFYWYFPSYAGLAEDVSKATGRPSSFGLGITFAILSIVIWFVTWIPFLGLLFMIGRYVIWLLYVRSMARDINKMIESSVPPQIVTTV